MLGGNKIGEAYYEVRADHDPMKKGLSDAERHADRKTKRIEQHYSRMATNIGKWGMVTFTLPTVAASKWALSVMADAERVESRFNALFRHLSEYNKQWASNLSESTRRNSDDIMNIMGVFQDLFVPMGMTRQAASELSRELTNVTVDMQSFYGGSKDAREITQALQSGLVGNYRALRQYGILLREADVEQRALEMSGKRSADQLDDQDRVMARAQLTIEGVKDAMGASDRMAGLYNETMRQLRSTLEDVAKGFGQVLKPSVQGFVNDAVIPALDAINQMNEAEKRAIVNLVAWGAAIFPALFAFGKLKAMVAALGAGLSAIPIVGGAAAIAGLGIATHVLNKGSEQREAEAARSVWPEVFRNIAESGDIIKIESALEELAQLEMHQEEMAIIADLENRIEALEEVFRDIAKSRDIAKIELALEDELAGIKERVAKDKEDMAKAEEALKKNRLAIYEDELSGINNVMNAQRDTIKAAQEQIRLDMMGDVEKEKAIIDKRAQNWQESIDAQEKALRRRAITQQRMGEGFIAQAEMLIGLGETEQMREEVERHRLNEHRKIDDDIARQEKAEADRKALEERRRAERAAKDRAQVMQRAFREQAIQMHGPTAARHFDIDVQRGEDLMAAARLESPEEQAFAERMAHAQAHRLHMGILNEEHQTQIDMHNQRIQEIEQEAEARRRAQMEAVGFTSLERLYEQTQIGLTGGAIAARSHADQNEIGMLRTTIEGLTDALQRSMRFS